MLYLTTGLTIYCCALAFLLGACMGSFLNCTAWRIVHGESILRGRSHCDLCGHVLAPSELVPIVSWLARRGRCRHCGGRLSFRHCAAELATGLSFVAILLKYDISLQMLEGLAFASVLLCCAFADLEGYMIPDRLLVIGLLVHLGALALRGGFLRGLLSSVLGGAAIALPLLLLILLLERVRKQELMGGGDIKLLFLTGFYLGAGRNLLCLMLAALIGIAAALAARKREAPIPWGPSIAAAALLCLLFGRELIGAYLSLF